MNDQSNQYSSRRAVLKSGAATLAAVAAAAGVSARAQAPEKLAQNVVQYQTSPKDGAQCSNCVNFEPPNGCKLVAGTIAPTGWCVAFAPKSS